MKLDYLILALKNLKHRGIRSWLTLLGIFIGVTAVVALIGLGSGLQAAVSGQFGVSSTEVILVQAGGVGLMTGLPGSGVVKPLTREDAEAIGRLSSVDLSIARNIETASIEFNDRMIVASVFAGAAGEARKFDYEMQNVKAMEGRLLKDGDSGKIYLGHDYSLKKKSGFDKIVKVGDKIDILEKKFEVIGILEKKGSFVTDKIIVMEKEDLGSLVDLGENVDVISVKIKDKDLMYRAKEDIEKLMRKRRDVDIGEEDFSLETPDTMLSTVNSILGGVRAFIIIIASISILVGALGIVNTMTTSILERRKEIGIMKAIGAKNSQVFMQFFFESGMLGFIGGLVGVIFGTLISVVGIVGINNFIGAELSPVIDFVLIGGALAGSFIIGAVAGIVPAMSAANQNPVEALRG